MKQSKFRRTLGFHRKITPTNIMSFGIKFSKFYQPDPDVQ